MKSLKKEDVINLSYKDITYLILQEEKKGVNTLDLFTKIINLLELPNDTIDTKIADFYTSLTTDKRFLMVDGLWDLRNRHTSDKILTSIDEDEDEETTDEIEDELTDEDNEPDFDEEMIDTDGYEDDDDDGLSDLVMVDEDDMNMDNE